MQHWRLSELNGYGRGQREIAGIVKGERGRAWIFFDGIETHLVPMEFATWDAARGIMTMPNWLAIRAYGRARERIRNRYRKRGGLSQ